MFIYLPRLKLMSTLLKAFSQIRNHALCIELMLTKKLFLLLTYLAKYTLILIHIYLSFQIGIHSIKKIKFKALCILFILIYR